MSKNMLSKDCRTLGIVLRRTNYAEADRILSLITPFGKVSAMAKGVRKAKSKLAGGVEMFSLADLNVHQGRGKLGMVTGAKMVEYYGTGILADFERMELAATILKKVDRMTEEVEDLGQAENASAEDFFEITRQSLKALNDGVDAQLVSSWFGINFLRASGEEMNLYRDINGEKLRADLKYDWNVIEGAFERAESGKFGADEIKLLRLMMTLELKKVKLIKVDGEMLTKIYGIIRRDKN
jgi:DNA repair protein RecO (recombination protein O)